MSAVIYHSFGALGAKLSVAVLGSSAGSGSPLVPAGASLGLSDL